MSFTIKIDIENDAFFDAPAEVARILRDVTRSIEWCGILPGQGTKPVMPLFDLNGNKVGVAEYVA